MEILYNFGIEEHNERKMPIEHSVNAIVEYFPLTSDEFKVALSRNDGADLSYNNLSIKIAKFDDKLVLSTFILHKYSVNTPKSGWQLKKEIDIKRYIIKINANNFYVTNISKGRKSRVRKKSVRQNVIKYHNVYKFAESLSTILEFDKKRSTKNNVKEIKKISTILCEELKSTLTKKNLLPNIIPTLSDMNLRGEFTHLICGSILEWFCKKNNIKFYSPWVLKLMSLQYITKAELKKYNNNYLVAFSDFYQLQNVTLGYIEQNIDRYFTIKASIPRLFIATALMAYMPPANFKSWEDMANSYSTYVSIDLLKTADGRNMFKNYLLYMRMTWQRGLQYAKFKYFIFGFDIGVITDLYFMGVRFKDVFLNNVNISTLSEFRDEIDASEHTFKIYNYSKEYRKAVEKPFQLNGITWSLKILPKNNHHIPQQGKDYMTILLTSDRGNSSELIVDFSLKYGFHILGRDDSLVEIPLDSLRVKINSILRTNFKKSKRSIKILYPIIKQMLGKKDLLKEYLQIKH